MDDAYTLFVNLRETDKRATPPGKEQALRRKIHSGGSGASMEL